MFEGRKAFATSWQNRRTVKSPAKAQRSPSPGVDGKRKFPVSRSVWHPLGGASPVLFPHFPRPQGTCCSFCHLSSPGLRGEVASIEREFQCFLPSASQTSKESPALSRLCSPGSPPFVLAWDRSRISKALVSGWIDPWNQERKINTLWLHCFLIILLDMRWGASGTRSIFSLFSFHIRRNNSLMYPICHG